MRFFALAKLEIQKKARLLITVGLDHYVRTLLKVIHFLEVILFAAYYDILEFLLACAGWNEVTADDIFLKTFEVIDAGADSCLAEHLGSLLE